MLSQWFTEMKMRKSKIDLPVEGFYTCIVMTNIAKCNAFFHQGVVTSS